MVKSGKLKKRQGRNSRLRRARADPQHQRLTVPYVAYIPYSTTVDVKFSDLVNTSVYTGVPWRMLSCSVEATVLNTKVSGKDSDIEYPAFLQAALNDAGSNNVESLSSVRFLVTSALVRTRRLRVPSPNVWKEDEQRSQALISLSNLTFGTGPTTVVVAHLQVTLEFGRIPLQNPSSLSSNFDLELLDAQLAALRVLSLPSTP